MAGVMRVFVAGGTGVIGRRAVREAAPDVIMHQLTDLKAVREAPEWVVLRYGLLYGPGTWYARDALMAERAGRGELAADGDVSSFVHVDDAAGAAVESLAWPTGAVNVCDDTPAAGCEWVPAFCRAVGAPSPSPALGHERHGWARGASNEYARKGLGWVPAYPSWRAGFAAL